MEKLDNFVIFSFKQACRPRESKLSSFHLEFSFNSIRYICLLFYCLVTFGFLWHKFCFKKIHWSDNSLLQVKSSNEKNLWLCQGRQISWKKSSIFKILTKMRFFWCIIHMFPTQGLDLASSRLILMIFVLTLPINPIPLELEILAWRT